MFLYLKSKKYTRFCAELCQAIARRRVFFSSSTVSPFFSESRSRVFRRSVVVVLVGAAMIPGRFGRQSLSVGKNKNHKSLLLLGGTQEKGTQLFRVFDWCVFPTKNHTQVLQSPPKKNKKKAQNSKTSRKFLLFKTASSTQSTARVGLRSLYYDFYNSDYLLLRSCTTVSRFEEVVSFAVLVGTPSVSASLSLSLSLSSVANRKSQRKNSMMMICAIGGRNHRACAN